LVILGLAVSGPGFYIFEERELFVPPTHRPGVLREGGLWPTRGSGVIEQSERGAEEGPVAMRKSQTVK